MANWLIRQTAQLNDGMNARVEMCKDILPVAYVGDHEGHVWQVAVMDGENAVDLDGYTVAAYFHREPDDVGVSIAVTGTIDGNICRATVPQEVYDYEGRVSAIMRITSSGGDKTTLAAVSFVVGEDMTSGGIIDPGDVIPTIDDLLIQMDALRNLNTQAQGIVDGYAEQVGALLRDSFGNITDPATLIWESGSFAAATGAVTSNVAYIRTPNYIRVRRGSTVSVTDLQSYRFQCMWYANADGTGFSADNSKAAGVREKYVVPQDGYLRVSIRDDNQSSLSDYSISQYLVLDLADGDSVTALRDRVADDRYAALDREAEMHGYTKFNASTITWAEGGLSTDGSFTSRSNRVGIERFVACKKGSYIRLLDKSYQMAICTYSGISAASKIAYIGYSQNDWIADRDCFVRMSMLKLDGPAISISAAAEAVEIAMFGGGGSRTEHGTISKDDGMDVDASGSNRMRMADGIYITRGTKIETGSDFPFYIRLYSDAACTNYVGNIDDALNTYTATRACWVRLVFAIADVYNLYSSDAITITDAATDDVRLNKIEGMVSVYDCLPITQAPGSIYQCADNIDGSLLPGANHLAEDRLTTIYKWWHALYSAHTDCMSEVSLGKDASGAHDVMCYTIEAPRGKGDGVPDDRYEILWLSNIHGHERYCLTSTYWFFKNLVEKHATDEHFAFLWAHCRFIVVPCVNPWGVAHAARTNANGVDLNRNYDASWTYKEDAVDGNSSRVPNEYVAEAETTLMTTLIKAHPNALFVVNRHDSGNVSSSTPGVGFSWFKDSFDMDRRVLEGMLRQLRTSFLDHYACASYAVPAVIRNLASSGATGTMDCWYNMIGMHGCLIESLCYNWGYMDGDTPVIDENAIDTLRMGVDINVATIEAVVTWANLIRACNDASIVYTPLPE